jgi:hypothetical protein
MEKELKLRKFSHNHHLPMVKMLAKYIRRGISVFYFCQKGRMKISGKLPAGLLIIGLVITSCAQATTPVPTMTSLPPTKIPFSTETPFPSYTPSPTDTFIPTNTPVPPTATPLPPTATPTVITGAELITYLPAEKDWPEECDVLTFGETLNWASGYCQQSNSFEFRITLSTSANPLSLADIKPIQGMDPIETPLFGQGTKAFKARKGPDIILQFFKGPILVKVEMTNVQEVNLPILDRVLKSAKAVDALIPADPVLPDELTFPKELQKDKLSTYFDELFVSVNPADYDVFTPSETKLIQNTKIGKDDKVCLIWQSVNSDWHIFFQVALLNLQTDTIERKDSYQMGGAGICHKLSINQSVAGDKYQIMVAADDKLVAVFPFETK